MVKDCVSKFRPGFGDLYWPPTRSQLFYMPLDRGVADLSCKVCHGVLFTMDRLISFGYDLPPACFCGHSLESADHLFFHCPLARSGVDWVQSLLFRSAPLARPLFYVMYFSALHRMNYLVFHVFLSICCMFYNIYSGIRGMITGSGLLGPLLCP